MGSPEALTSWRTHLAVFEERIWPVFRSYGYSKDMALLLYEMNMFRSDMGRDMEQLLDAVKELDT